MKKIVKFLSLILTITMFVSLASSCGKKHVCEHVCERCSLCTDKACTDEVCKNKCTCNNDVTDDIGSHTVSGMLHERNVKPSSRNFVRSDGSTAYSVVYDSSDGYAVTASAFITGHVLSATGATLSLEAYDGQTYDDGACYIVLNIYNIFTAAGLEMPQTDLGSAGYYVRTMGNSVFIMSRGDEGLQMGAIAFLEEVLGYDMVGDDFAVYEKDGRTLPEMEITEKPDYEFRDVTGQLTKSGQYGMGYTNNDIIMPVGGAKWHNSFALLNPEIYYAEHKGWYADTVTPDMRPTTQKAGQLCYTAHGNATEYAEMVQTAYEKLKKNAEEFPTLSGVSITEQDNYEWCDCQACAAMIKEYGANSATCLKFCNDVAEKLTEYFEPKGRRLIVYFFAYHGTEDAPATKGADGVYTANKGIKCHKNVGVIYAPIGANFYRSLYDEENFRYAEVMKAWKSVCDNIGLWIYQTNFKNYFYPFNSWDTVAESYRFGKENGAVYIFDQGQMNVKEQTAFSKLKEYVSAKLAVNVNLDSQKLTEKFFKYYYGEGGEYMYEMYDDIRLHLNTLYQKYPAEIKGYIYEGIANSSYWTKKQLEKYLTLIDKAYDAISKIRYTEPEKYAVLKEHICLESLFPRYALCTLFSDSYQKGELMEMRRAFKADADYFGYDRDYETTANINSVYESWGIL